MCDTPGRTDRGARARRVVALAALAATPLGASPALAFQCMIPPLRVHLWPHTAGVEQALLPPNAPGFAYWISERADRVEIHLERAAGGAGPWRPVKHTLREDGPVGLIVPDPAHPLRPGDRWRVKLMASADQQRAQASVEVTIGQAPLVAEQLKPKLVLEPQARAALQVSQDHPKLAVQTMARRARVELGSRALEPYINALLWETQVDGERWVPHELCDDREPGRSWRGVGQDLIWTRCDQPVDEPSQHERRAGPLKRGQHEVVMRGRLPGTTITIVASAKGALSCPAGDEPPPSPLTPPAKARQPPSPSER